MGNNESGNKSCPHCGTVAAIPAKFCSKCGKGIVTPGQNTFTKDFNSFLLSCFGIIGYILALYLLKIEGNGVNNLIVDFSFLAIVIAILYFGKNNIRGILSFENFKLSRLFKYIFLQLLITGTVIAFSLYLDTFLKAESSNELDSFSDFFSPITFAIISVGVFPAITEEIAFRGILFNSLLKLTTPVSTIFVTGIIFGFVHFSFISILWLIPAGLFFGWIRYKEGIIWYGVACHFLNNFIVVMIDYFKYHPGLHH